MSGGCVALFMFFLSASIDHSTYSERFFLSGFLLEFKAISMELYSHEGEAEQR